MGYNNRDTAAVCGGVGLGPLSSKKTRLLWSTEQPTFKDSQ